MLSFIAYSNYKEKDVVGRKIAFMFRTDVQKGIDVKNLELLLEKASAKYGYHVSSNPYDILHELKKKRIIRLVIGGVIILSCIIFAVLFYN